jgi:RimJ/RimL family protein N-acetyltransferase
MRIDATGTHPATIALPDGAELVVRPVGRGDEALLAALVETLSQDTAYRRFLGPKARLTIAERRYFTDLDHRDHEALLALDPRTGAAVAVARYIRDPRRHDTAELAVVVGDRWQARGLGTALSRRLAQRACAHGIRRFRGLTLAENRPALRLVERLGPTTVVRDGRTVEVETQLGSGLAA